MKLLLKNTFKKIFKSFGRFLSITFIIALGISVFIGLRESTAGMLHTADNYYDTHNLMDFKITSTHGFTSGDINSLSSLNNVEKVIPSYSLDVMSSGSSIRVHALEKDVNNVMLIKGRMPISNDECVGDYYQYQLGKYVEFESDNLKDVLSISKCKVVGLIKSVLYIRNDKGISTVGNGKLISYIFVKKETFISEYYTDIYLVANNSKLKRSYYDEYNVIVNPLRQELEQIKPIRETIRYEEILKKANDEIIKVKKDLNNELNSSTKKLNASKKTLDETQITFETAKNEKIELFENGLKELNKNKKDLIESLLLFDIKENELGDSLKTLNENIILLKNQLSLLTKESEEFIALNNQIIELEEKYNNLLIAQNSLNEINKKLDELNSNYELFKTEILKKEMELQNGFSEYQNGLVKIEDAKKEANTKINEAKEELNSIEKPIWYLLDRTDNTGYIAYKEDIIKVEAIAKVLPIFFILIAVLMILNTLTRLIEEERNEIGILQSNGFSKSSIVASYLVYVLVAGFLGLGLGLTIGYSLIPQIIYGVFLASYYVPNLITIVSPLPFSLVISVTLLMIIFVTITATRKELRQNPANLLRPKPPKTGKKIFLEKFDFIWSKLHFMGKTTIRNIFRYKKRIIMTILGVSGCTALLVTGLGINDSINTISKIQYQDIIKYDAMYILKDEVTTLSEDLIKLYKNNGVVNPLLVNQNAYTFSFANKTEDAYMVVPSDSINFNNYVNLTSIVSNKKISIDDRGAIITKKMADLLDVKIGDLINIRNSDNELIIIYISDITNNYVSHYIYMSNNYYKEVFENDIKYNSVIANGKINNNIKLTEYNVLMVNYTEDIVKTFDTFVAGINQIIILIVVFACFLAFVVLYNLTIINVSERKREIATFKVLGFYDKEISSYVYRETFVLTIFGIILGLFLGIVLHRFVIGTAETDSIMFLRKINLISFILSGLITIIFSVIVQGIINRVLKKIDMIESLKSAE